MLNKYKKIKTKSTWNMTIDAPTDIRKGKYENKNKKYMPLWISQCT